MEKESENPILETTTAILIAVIVVIGALASWRASVIDDAAGDADYAGLRAAVFSVRAQALNSLNAYESYGNYVSYERNKKFAGLLEEDLKDAPEDQQALLTEQMKVANDLADADRSLFDTKYLNRDGSYSVQRQLGVMQADAARENDLDYESQFADADKGRARTRNMLFSVMILSIATVFYAMVESVEGRTKIVMVGLGSLAAIAGIVMAAMIWFGA
jgi:Ca2+/H+ antiporter